MKRPLVFAAWLSICANAAAGKQNLQFFMLATLLVILIVLLLLVFKKMTIKQSFLFMLVWLLFASVRGYTDIQNYSPLTRQQTATQNIEGSMTITSSVNIDGNRVQFYANVYLLADGLEGKKEKMLVQIYLQKEDELVLAKGLKRGNKLASTGSLSRPATASNYEGFDYREYLRYQKVHWIWNISGMQNIKVLEQTTSVSLYILKLIDDARIQLSSPIDKLFDDKQSGYIKGLILGIREHIDEELFNHFAQLGLTHIIAISGLHVAVFIYMIGGIFKLLKMSSERISLLLLFLIPFYVLLTGAAPSIIRAGLMAMLALWLARKKLLKDGQQIIAFVAMLMTLVQPYMIHQISFQLSFIVTYGLIVLVPRLRSCMPTNSKLKPLYDLASVTITAQLISFPLTIYYFNQFNPLSFLANFILVPYISFIVLPLATISMLLGHISIPLADEISRIVEAANQFSFEFIEKLGIWKQMNMIWASPSLIWILLWYSFIYFYIHHLRLFMSEYRTNMNKSTPSSKLMIKSKVNIMIVTALLAGLLLYAYYPRFFHFQLSGSVSVLSVGQGDAILIRTPKHKTILIDGGGSLERYDMEEWKKRNDPFEVGKDVLVPLLKKRGVSNIDILVISHFDHDHVGGLIEVIKQIPVKEVWFNGTYKTSASVEQLIQLIYENNITMKSVYAETKLILDEYTELEAIWPLPHEGIVSLDEQNESSIVILLRMFEYYILLTGDIGKQSEQEIIERRRDKGLSLPKIDIMKVAHHGSKYSTDYLWLSVFEPRAAIISAGDNNFYGHPHPDTLSRLESYQANVYRTDLYGEVAFILNESIVKFIHWNKYMY